MLIGAVVAYDFLLFKEFLFVFVTLLVGDELVYILDLGTGVMMDVLLLAEFKIGLTDRLEEFFPNFEASFF